MSLLHPIHNPSTRVMLVRAAIALNTHEKNIKAQVAKSISESLSAESESFANYLATKLMREFNVTLKD